MPRMVLALCSLVLNDLSLCDPVLRIGRPILRISTTRASREEDTEGQDPKKRTYQPVFLNECFHIDYPVWFVFSLCLICVFSVFRSWFSKIIRGPG